MSSIKKSAVNNLSPGKIDGSPIHKMKKFGTKEKSEKKLAGSAQKEADGEEFETIIKVDKKTEEKIRKMKYTS